MRRERRGEGREINILENDSRFPAQDVIENDLDEEVEIDDEGRQLSANFEHSSQQRQAGVQKSNEIGNFDC